MFTRARWQLTFWFAGAFAVILAVAGSSVYLTTRATLYGQVNDDLRSRSQHEAPPLTTRLGDASNRGQPPGSVPIGPSSAAGGYFYALVSGDGAIVDSSGPVESAELASAETEQKALAGESTFVDTQSLEGDPLRVYVTAVQDPNGQVFVLEVGRSVQPEQNLLRGLLVVLIGGGGAGVLLALGGGFLIAGRALRPIRAAVDRQNTFVADASHELRTPLALIRTSAELLKRHPAQTVRANMESVDDVIHETDRLSNLVSQMLNLARADAGRAQLDMGEVDMDELTADVVRQMRLLCKPDRMPLEIRANGSLKLKGDASRLRELLLILLDNAMKHGGPDGPIQVTLQHAGGKVLLRVSDQGNGIPQHALPHIFDRFYRVDKARSRGKGGSGLGLAIAKWIVHAHQGTIRIDSAVGTGTTVTVELPSR
ncbi:MAG: HAMP domain-containing sensor histidine kinase [Dehalococcoidia bacterium]